MFDNMPVHQLPTTESMRTKSKKTIEPPPANLDEVKRRFIRQNRDLAKANSTQSLRIRNLEIENTRLLDEILRLRERNLWLERERQNVQINVSSEAISKLKDELQAKFSELSGFIDGIAKVNSESSDQDYLIPKEKLLSPSQRQYKERQPLSELMQECLMPTISEHKTFPRRTLDAEDIRIIRLSDQSSDGSPDPGSPPVSRINCSSGAQTMLFAAEEEHAPEKEGDGKDELSPDISVNLETRRRKREGQSKLEVRRHTPLPHMSEDLENGGVPAALRVGAKRKLADRDPEKPIKPPSQDDFTFSRKPTGIGRAMPITDTSLAENEVSSADVPKQRAAIAPTSPVKPIRQILGDKSTNLSPQKPQSRIEKQSKVESGNTAPSKLTVSRQRAQPRNRRISSMPSLSAEVEPPPKVDILPPISSTTTNNDGLPPKTPATEDVFSPGLSEESARQLVDRGDTPPPTDLNNIISMADGGQRPSRRARSAVNYAEPSLISKMRRPGKEMVDAISGIKDPRSSMNASGMRKSQSFATSSQSTSAKKDSQHADETTARQDVQNIADSTNRELDPGSPLRSKTTKLGPGSVYSTIRTVVIDPAIKTEPPESPQPRSPTIPRRSAPSSTVIPTSNSATRKRRETIIGNLSMDNNAASQRRADTDEAARRIEEMNLYDFKESSSPSSDKSEKSIGSNVNRARGVVTSRTGLSSQRRHSSILKENSEVNSRTSIATVAPIVVGRSERMESRRRSTLL